jgi:hypothetical protein
MRQKWWKKTLKDTVAQVLMDIAIAVRTMSGLEYQRVPPTFKVLLLRQEVNIEKWKLVVKRSVNRNTKQTHPLKLQYNYHQIQQDRAPPN